MPNDNYIKGAKKRKEAQAKIEASVDDFFEKREAKREAYVPRPLKWRKLGIGLYQLFFEGGGEVPYEFSGLYTSLHAVNQAIEKHQLKCQDKLR